MKKIVTALFLVLSMAGCGKKPPAAPAPVEFVVKPAPKLSAEAIKRMREERAKRRADFYAKRAAAAASASVSKATASSPK